jgi:hypothetical protein
MNQGKFGQEDIDKSGSNCTLWGLHNRNDFINWKCPYFGVLRLVLKHICCLDFRSVVKQMVDKHHYIHKNQTYTQECFWNRRSYFKYLFYGPKQRRPFIQTQS